MELRPLNDRILIKRIKEKTQTEGGIIIPDNLRKKQQQGIVVAVGKGCYINSVFKPTTTKVGEKVLFGEFAGSEFQLNGQPLLILREDDILGTLE